MPSPNGTDKSLGDIVSEVSEKGSLLVREEIELAKAEIVSKAKTMGRGAGIGVAAGIFLVFALVMFLQTLAWFLVDAFDLDIWAGFGIVTLILVIFGIVAGLLAAKWLKAGPPTPDMAIEQAKITRETLEAHTPQEIEAKTAQETPKP